MDVTIGGQTVINRLVWGNGYAEVVNGAAGGGGMYCWMFTLSGWKVCTTDKGISYHCGALLEVEWEDNCCRPEVEGIVAAYNRREYYRPTYHPPGEVLIMGKQW
jgi:hypothetical protein